eukprot:3577052-Pyramimonas_sp.AAC.2
MAIDSACVTSVPWLPAEYRSVRQSAVPPRYASAVGLELCQRDVGGAARGLRVVGAVGRHERLGALGVKGGGDDVGGGVQVALGVAADQMAILGDGDVALDDASAHARGGGVGLVGVLGELQGGTAMSDGEGMGLHHKVGVIEASLELGLQSGRLHVVNQVLDAGSQLNLLGGVVLTRRLSLVVQDAAGVEGGGCRP